MKPDLAELRGLLERATPGPWHCQPWAHSFGVTTALPGRYSNRVAECIYWQPNKKEQPDRTDAQANAALIVWLRNNAASLLTLAEAGMGAGWRPIEEAPRDGTVIIARNADHPEWGSWPMVRNVRHVLVDGEWICQDLGGWLHIEPIAPDYERADPTSAQAEIPFASATDENNKSVRYEWQPLPAPPEEVGRE